MGSTPYRTITVAPGPHGFSAEVTGLQLQRPLPAATLAEVKRAWAEFSVLYFPRQPLTHEQLETFSLQFGEFGHDPYVKPLPGHPNILEIRRVATEKASVFGAAWHSDWSFQATPPAATILHSKVTPPVGGRTWFADGYRAYEALSPVFQQLLANLKTVHSARLAYGPRGLFAQDSTPRTMQIIVSESAENTEIHPLVRTHPVSQRKALFINPVYTVGIAGMTEEESKALLGFLFRHMQREEFIYRHQWQPDMLTMWDNRCTMHYAEGGYDGHLRVMHRTTVAGERPR